jgi:hypothetical protein
MPIPKYDGSPEKEWISSCMNEIGSEYDQEQALAICYKQMEMSDALPAVKGGETLETYIRRCVPTIYKEGGDYDQRVATGMCADHYEGKTTQMSSVFRKIKGIKLY